MKPPTFRLFSIMIVAWSVVLGCQTARVLFPLLIFNPTYSTTNTAIHLAAVFLIPCVLPLLLRRKPPHLVIGGAIVGLVLCRITMQLVSSASDMLLFATIGMVCALVCLYGYLTSPSFNGEVFAIGLLFGLSGDVILHTAGSTWDSVWQRGVMGQAGIIKDFASPLLADFWRVIGVLILVLPLLVALWKLRHVVSTTSTLNEGLILRPITVAIGPFFALHLLILHNAGVVTALTGWLVWGAASAILLVDVLTIFLWRFALGRIQLLGLSIAFIAGLFLLWLFSGHAAGICLVVLQLICGLLLIPLVAPAQQRPVKPLPVAIVLGLSSLLILVLIAANYIGYQYRMPEWIGSLVYALAGLLIVIPVLVYGMTFFRVPQPTQAMGAMLGLLIVAIVQFVLGNRTGNPNDLSAPPVERSIRLVTYNVHQGANTAGWLDLEALAKVIESLEPDVVVLQEVVRGQVITGSTDLATWFSQRLGMDYRFAPAADPTYGELLLTNLPIDSAEAVRLPRGEAAQYRGYIAATLRLPDGSRLNVIGTHLDHTSSEARQVQIKAILERWKGQPNTIIAGDLNAVPDTPEINMLKTSGFVSAQDQTGNVDLFTFPSTGPHVRIDWVFGTPDLTFGWFVIPPTRASDHLPVVVSMAITPPSPK